MNASVILPLGFGISMFMIAVLLFNAIRKNFQFGQLLRKQILEKIESLRFGSMLRKHNVNPQEYLHNRPLSSIESEIKNCFSCMKITECDSVLAKSNVTDQDLVFCPNHSSIVQKNI